MDDERLKRGSYLTAEELKLLNRMVTSYLDFAEDMAERKIPLTMENWEKDSTLL